MHLICTIYLFFPFYSRFPRPPCLRSALRAAVRPDLRPALPIYALLAALLAAPLAASPSRMLPVLSPHFGTEHRQFT